MEICFSIYKNISPPPRFGKNVSTGVDILEPMRLHR